MLAPLVGYEIEIEQMCAKRFHLTSYDYCKSVRAEEEKKEKKESVKLFIFAGTEI